MNRGAPSPRALSGSEHPQGPVRVWVPACTTGEEAYSVAILLLEQFRATKKPISLQLHDIDDESLDVARHGIYAASSVALALCLPFNR